MPKPSLIKLIQDSKLKEIQGDLVTSTVVALQQLKKVVTAETARSVRGETTKGSNFVDIGVLAAGGMKYIVEGKPANTKMPLMKVGDKFVLFKRISDWKNIVGFSGSDFVLARAIAKNKRDPVDVAAKTLEVYNKLFAPKLKNTIITLTAKEVANRVKKA